MTELLEFEWERLVDGYRLERLDANLLNFIQGDYWFIGRVDSSAPQWVRDLSCSDVISGDAIKHFLDTYQYGDRYMVANGQETERYRPVEMYPALFMELADSEATPEGAARFISRYGPPKYSPESILDPGELWVMLKHMSAIKSAVRSWERYRKTGKVRAFFKRVTPFSHISSSFGIRHSVVPSLARGGLSW